MIVSQENNENNNNNKVPNPVAISQLPQFQGENTYQFFINDVDKNISTYNFKNNKIDTTKYNIITFIPKALLLQFVRLANIYFLVCAILQCIPLISPLTPATAVVPLVIVLSVSIIRLCKSKIR